MAPQISICIPAYKNVGFLRRLLDSIACQTFTAYEVIITDDSPDNSVGDFAQSYSKISSLKYFHNAHPLGTPSNWNAAISHASGEWIKLMHDDDWFSQNDSLERFANAVKNTKADLLFSSYKNVHLSTGREEEVNPSSFRLKQLILEPVTLISTNVIGPPSVVIHRNDHMHPYDASFKWLVDIDNYIARLEDGTFEHIPFSLVNVGVGDEQVTASVHGSAAVEIPEHFHFLEKTGIHRLRNILVYDYWWRFFRNFKVRNKRDLENAGYNGKLHPVLASMISMQRKMPRAILKNGLISKSVMTMHFLMHKNKLKA